MPRVGHLRESLWNPNVRMEKIDEVFTFFSWGKKKKEIDCSKFEIFIASIVTCISSVIISHSF